ncbi:Sec-independent protein translocase subunit TatA [Pectobacteriaceae bacterium CE70]|uniref:Sec-independent protein translocase protein TatA n=1 Tax=Serratia sp. (strain ATCC 39006) TaxID=104623 RepID=A0A2I5T1U8_SERS3|nr:MULTISPECIES: Sec-independent protein translocase subunit TatA [Enterobacterales]WJV58508.1 Sec-independent protein translocase subunit TatA [Pectobacteriaceae bacterium C111]WJV62808.1 Sec-independent protein translocase subunit TatA [Pectobacteriaceae bacterium C52]WJV67143.1 Sec-independent protein translocase subunit TatA [Pectobacteriaceae bacterium CE70]WJY11127.1 Sec-independent protein translocase subunit TatA [Pectobacteriaceae bacterium C80]WJY14844.1 Sec-independent protein trans
MGGISIPSLLIIAVIVVLLFGTNKLRTLGSDLGASIKGFKKAISEEPSSADDEKTQQDADFATKSIADQKPEAKQEEKSKNKEQV